MHCDCQTVTVNEPAQRPSIRSVQEDLASSQNEVFQFVGCKLLRPPRHKIWPLGQEPTLSSSRVVARITRPTSACPEASWIIECAHTQRCPSRPHNRAPHQTNPPRLQDTRHSSRPTPSNLVPRRRNPAHHVTRDPFTRHHGDCLLAAAALRGVPEPSRRRSKGERQQRGARCWQAPPAAHGGRLVLSPWWRVACSCCPRGAPSCRSTCGPTGASAAASSSSMSTTSSPRQSWMRPFPRLGRVPPAPSLSGASGW